jgi:hypothetical protein
LPMNGGGEKNGTEYLITDCFFSVIGIFACKPKTTIISKMI